MAVNSSLVSPLTGLHSLGVAIWRPDPVNHPDQLHVGILYRIGGDAPRICHLAFHFNLLDQPVAAIQQFHWAESGLDSINKMVSVAWIANLEKNRRNIPYGFDATGCCFDLVTGEFIPPPPGKGMTCATFVLGAFASLGLGLLDLNSWPHRPEDDAWQVRMIGLLDGYCASRNLDCTAHIEALRADVGNKRIRPEEAAAGVISPNIPLAFPDARLLADQILTDLG